MKCICTSISRHTTGFVTFCNSVPGRRQSVASLDRGRKAFLPSQGRQMGENDQACPSPDNSMPCQTCPPDIFYPSLITLQPTCHNMILTEWLHPISSQCPFVCLCVSTQSVCKERVRRMLATRWIPTPIWCFAGLIADAWEKRMSCLFPNCGV